MRLLRTLSKNIFFFTINIAGLSIAIAVFMLVSQYVFFETSYEDFVQEGDNVYRVALERYNDGELETRTAENYPGVGPALMTQQGVESYARLYNLGYKNNVVLTNEEASVPIAIKQTKFLYADSAFLLMMGYTLTQGDITTALAKPGTAVITQKMANIYFGESDPLGKVLHMHDDDNNNETVVVTGVVDNVPDNTHLKFDVLFSYNTLFTRTYPGRNITDYLRERFDGWSRNDMYTYIKVKEGTDVATLESRFPSLVDFYKPQSKNPGERNVLFLQPLRDIHLTSNLAEEWEANGNERYVLMLGLVGIFVLVIGWINYINLSTAKAAERAREVGVYKVMGALRSQLITRFLSEAASINAVAILFSFAIAGAVLPLFNSISGIDLSVSCLVSSWFLLLVVAIWLIGTCLSGIYPAFVLSSFDAAKVLKGKLHRSTSGVALRKSLIVFQFTASVVLISGTLIVFNQLKYMMNGDIGVNVDHVLVLQRPGIGAPRSGNNEMDAFRNELKKDPSIVAVTGSSTIPGMVREYKNNVKRYGAPDDTQITVRLNSMDYDFNEVFEMKVIAGRIFSRQYLNDRDTSVVITESAVQSLGFKSPDDAIGQAITVIGWDWNPVVVGVVNDYHQVSFKERLEPTMFYCDPFEGEFYSIKIASSDLPKVVDHVKAAWQKSFPGNPFDYFFLDQYFDRQYKGDEQFAELFTAFAILALLTGCIGLFGLSSYTMIQRTKEIGIRKVLGSSVPALFALLVRDYIRLILIAAVVGIPLVYLVMNDWLESFAFRAPISILVFIIAALSVLFIAVATVSFQTIKVALSNPIDALRYE
ncbi:MAG: ABC transporter permease [Bacteroidota bacterium]